MQNKRKQPVLFFFRHILNKYTVSLLGFGLWIAVLDQDSLIEQMQLRAQINRLKNDKNYYLKKIKEDKRKKEELLSNRENLEKFAREQYLMKKENEDIFIIKE